MSSCSHLTHAFRGGAFFTAMHLQGDLTAAGVFEDQMSYLEQL